jgi:hypothetical protein
MIKLECPWCLSTDEAHNALDCGEEHLREQLIAQVAQSIENAEDEIEFERRTR